MYKKFINLFAVIFITTFYSNSALAVENRLVEELMEKSGLNFTIDQILYFC